MTATTNTTKTPFWNYLNNHTRYYPNSFRFRISAKFRTKTSPLEKEHSSFTEVVVLNTLFPPFWGGNSAHFHPFKQTPRTKTSRPPSILLQTLRYFNQINYRHRSIPPPIPVEIRRTVRELQAKRDCFGKPKNRGPPGKETSFHNHSTNSSLIDLKPSE